MKLSHDLSDLGLLVATYTAEDPHSGFLFMVSLLCGLILLSAMLGIGFLAWYYWPDLKKINTPQ